MARPASKKFLKALTDARDKDRRREKLERQIADYGRAASDPREWPHHREQARKVLFELTEELKTLTK